MPRWSALIGSCSSDFRLVMEVRWPPWAPTPAGLLAPKWGLVAPEGRSGGKSWVRGLDITSRQKLEEGEARGEAARTCRLLKVQDRDNPIRGCNWQARRQHAKTEDGWAGEACVRALPIFTWCLVFVRQRTWEKEERADLSPEWHHVPELNSSSGNNRWRTGEQDGPRLGPGPVR